MLSKRKHRKELVKGNGVVEEESGQAIQLRVARVVSSLSIFDDKKKTSFVRVWRMKYYVLS